MISKFWRLVVVYRAHILMWALYIGYEWSYTSIFLGVKDTPMDYITHYIVLMSIFYFNAHVILPRYLTGPNKSRWKLLIALLVVPVSYCIIDYGLDELLIYTHYLTIKGPFNFDVRFAVLNYYRAAFIIGYSTGYYYLITFLKQRKLTEELEKQRLNEIILRQKAEQEVTKAHNAFLKAQINPHFLFNTLDFIYHNILEVSPFAAEAIVTLADMMRYAIDSDKTGEYIMLGDEIDQVMSLQYLNQIRKNVEINFHLSYPNAARELHFIPLVLLTLTENIFKHGNLTGKHSATLKISIKEKQLIIETENFSMRTFSASTQRGNRTGLANIEKRLNYAYGNAASMVYGTDDLGHFKLNISVPVQLLHEIA